MDSRKGDDRDKTVSYTILAGGTRCKQYEIIGCVASGGMGQVYAARDTELERTVALKFLPDTLGPSREARERLRREAKAAARLSHPNIVTIHEVGDMGGRPYIAMELVRGKTLGGMIREGPMNPSMAGHLALEIARGLQAAHQNGILHRDIKPANIVVTEDGTAKILDFGLAWLAGAAGTETPSAVVGTVGYSSPEQLQGQPVDERTDIWAWGVVLYEMLTGRRPFRGSDPGSTIYATLNENPEDPATSRSDVPECLRSLCLACLQRNPTERPQSMDEILEALGQCPSEIFTPRALRTKRRRRPLLIALIGVVAALIAWQFLLRPEKNATTQGAADNTRRLAVLPFRLSGTSQALADWPEVVQTLLVNDLTGAQGFGVVDPLTLRSILPGNGPVQDADRTDSWYSAIGKARIPRLIDGVILPSSNGYTIQSSLVDTRTRTVLFSTEMAVANDAALFQGVNEIAERVRDFLQTTVLRAGYEKDVGPWIGHGTHNLKALKAFMQASRIIFNRLPGSETYLRRAIDQDPKFVAPRIWLISALVSTGRKEEAEKQYEVLSSLQEQANPFEQAMIQWARAYINGNVRLEANALQLALNYSPLNNILLYNLALCRRQEEDYQGAIDALEPVLETSWHYSSAYAEMAYCKSMIGEFDSARKVLEKSLSIRPVDPEVQLLLGILLRRKPDVAAARTYEDQYIRERVAAGNSKDDVYAELGRWSNRFGLYTVAANYFQMAITVNPDPAVYHSGLGQADYSLGRYAAAIESCNEAVRLDSSVAEPFRILGQVYEKMDSTVLALKYYREFLMRDSASADARQVKNDIGRLEE